MRVIPYKSGWAVKENGVIIRRGVTYKECLSAMETIIFSREKR